MTPVNPLTSYATQSLFPAATTAAPTTSTSSSNNSTSSAETANQLTGNSFIQLLTAQLQAQDPTNPLDPTTFVTELVQFNQLQQLIDINQTLSSAAGSAQSGTAQSDCSQSASPNASAITI